MALIRADGVIESRPAIAEIAIEIQPSKDLNLRLSAESIVPEPLPDPGFTAPTLIDSKESLTREVETNTDQGESLVAVLYLIAAVLIPSEEIDPFQRRLVGVLWIEIQLSVSPSGRKSGAVVESSIHLKVISVMLDLCSKRVLAITEKIVNLLGSGTSLGRRTHPCLRLEECRGELLPLLETDGQIASCHAIVPAGMLGVSENGADIIRFTQAVGHAGNVKRFVPAGNRFTTISKIFRTGIGGIQNTE